MYEKTVITFILSIEISVMSNKELHIVGYYITTALYGVLHFVPSSRPYSQSCESD